MEGIARMRRVGLRRAGLRRVGPNAVGALLVATAVAACGSADDSSSSAAPTTTTQTITDPGPFFAECAGLSDDEVAGRFGLGPFASVTRNSVGCEWETYVGGPSVSFSWYRGSPIGRERAGSDLIGRPATDVEIGGNPGFRGSSENAEGQTVLCEIGVQFGGDFIHWSVTYAEFTPVADPCEVARELAELSVERSR